MPNTVKSFANVAKFNPDLFAIIESLTKFVIEKRKLVNC